MTSIIIRAIIPTPGLLPSVGYFFEKNMFPQPCRFSVMREEGSHMKKIRTIEATVIMEKKLKVCAYCRVSSDLAEQKNSFSAHVETVSCLKK